RPSEVLGRRQSAPTGGSAPRLLGPVPALDGLRGLSIIAVLATHVVFLDDGRDRFALRGGFLGVDVFLALSGFLIGLVLLREADTEGQINRKAFARRRLRRLLPPLVVFLIIEGVLAVTVLGTTAREQGIQSVLALTFTANWQLSFGHQPPYALVHLWSLALEAQFYVLLLGLMVWCRRRLHQQHQIVAGLVLGAAAVILWRLALLRWGLSKPAIYERTDARLDSMLFGAAAAFVWRGRLLRDQLLDRLGVVALVALGVCWVVASPADGWLFRGGFTAIAAAAAVLVAAGATGHGIVARLGHLRPLRWIGMISFSLYLWHLPIYLTVVAVLPDAPLMLKLVVAVSGSIAAGWLGFVLVERRVLASWRRSTTATLEST
ncbi:MAG: acyltransferase family protein, partial [Actinomycetes bacterium]